MGTKTVARALAGEIEKKHTVLKLDVNNPFSWKKVRAFKPDVVHFVLGPTVSGFLITKVFSLLSRSAKVIISAPNPTLKYTRLLSRLKPDLILTQALYSEEKFRDLGFKTSFLPNGVNTNRFSPISEGAKDTLRDTYGIDRNKFVILHVGPIIQRRNVERLLPLQREATHTLLIGRAGADKTLNATLRQSGFQIIDQYIANINEMYALSDCYVFPTFPENRGASIEMPLSVLEAMACDLPIVTTAFGALPRVFSEGEGFFFAETPSEIDACVERIRGGGIPVSTRHKVLPYSWHAVSLQLEGLYEQIMA